MLASAEILKLKEERQRLLTESELNRRALMAEFAQLASFRAWLPAGVTWLHKVRSILMVIAPFAGFLWARRRPSASPSASGLVAKTLTAFQFLRKIYAAWQFIQSRLR